MLLIKFLGGLSLPDETILIVAGLAACFVGGQVLANYTKLKLLGWTLTIITLLGVVVLGVQAFDIDTPVVELPPWTSSPIMWFAIAIALTFASIMIFGVKRHIQVSGDGAMHAATIVAVIAFIIFIVGVGFYVGSEVLWEGEAADKRADYIAMFAKKLDPANVDGIGINWKWVWMGVGVLIALVILLKPAKDEKGK